MDPQFSDHWDGSRAIAYWITQFLDQTLENIKVMADEANRPTPTEEPPGTPYMEHTRDLDELEYGGPGLES